MNKIPENGPMTPSKNVVFHDAIAGIYVHASTAIKNKNAKSQTNQRRKMLQHCIFLNFDVIFL